MLKWRTTRPEIQAANLHASLHTKKRTYVRTLSEVSLPLCRPGIVRDISTSSVLPELQACLLL